MPRAILILHCSYWRTQSKKMKELEMLFSDLIDASVRGMLSIKKFDEWLNKSRKGDKIMYYRGFLFAPNQQKLSPTLDLKRVEKLATYVRNTHHRNTVTMVQKKHDDFDYEYWAVRT